MVGAVSANGPAAALRATAPRAAGNSRDASGEAPHPVADPDRDGPVARRATASTAAPAARERAFGRHVLASIALHAAGVMAVAALAIATEPRRATEMPIELIAVEPPSPPPAPPPPPPRPIVKPVAPPPGPPASRPVEIARAEATSNVLDTAPRPTPEPPREPAAPPAPVPTPSVVAPPAPTAGGPVGHPPSPRGELLAAANPDAAGSGVPGPGGLGAVPRGPSAPAPAVPPAATALNTGITALARPLGGYQVKPAYPESARRARIQGVALLRFLVLATGRVGSVTVAESAGHGDLDRAAIDAVKQWRFEPARRGPEPVDVWVTLPVRFELAR